MLKEKEFKEYLIELKKLKYESKSLEKGFDSIEKKKIAIEEQIQGLKEQIEKLSNEKEEIDEEFASKKEKLHSITTKQEELKSKKDQYTNEIEHFKANFTDQDENTMLCVICCSFYDSANYPCLLTCCGNTICNSCGQNRSRCVFCRKTGDITVVKNLALLNVIQSSMRHFDLFSTYLVLFEKKVPLDGFYDDIKPDKLSKGLNLVFCNPNGYLFDFETGVSKALGKTPGTPIRINSKKYGFLKGSGKFTSNSNGKVKKAPLSIELRAKFAQIEQSGTGILFGFDGGQKIFSFNTKDIRLEAMKESNFKGKILKFAILNSKALVFLGADNKLKLFDLDKESVKEIETQGKIEDIQGLENNCVLAVSRGGLAFKVKFSKKIMVEPIGDGNSAFKKVFSLKNGKILAEREGEVSVIDHENQTTYIKAEFEGEIQNGFGNDQLTGIVTDKNRLYLFDVEGKEVNNYAVEENLSNASFILIDK